MRVRWQRSHKIGKLRVRRIVESGGRHETESGSRRGTDSSARGGCDEMTAAVESRW